MRSSDQLNIQHSTFNIAVGFVPMFSVKCLMLNCYGAKQLTTEQLFIACVAANNSKFKTQNS